MKPVELSNPEISSTMDARGAIASAMMMTQQYLLLLTKDYRKYNLEQLDYLRPRTRSPWNNMYFSRTKDICDRASLFVATILTQQYNHLFQHIFLIKSEYDNQSKYQHPDQSDTDYWKYHVYAIMQDKNGRWYGVSPANRPLEDADIQKFGDPMTTILEAPNLTTVMHQIHNSVGGSWPNANNMEKTLRQGLLRKIRSVKYSENDVQLRAPCLQQRGDFYDGEIELFRLLPFRASDFDTFGKSLGLQK